VCAAVPMERALKSLRWTLESSEASSIPFNSPRCGLRVVEVAEVVNGMLKADWDTSCSVDDHPREGALDPAGPMLRTRL
jgi:hypothetical protein